MKPGRELDALVAEKVLGLRRDPINPRFFTDYLGTPSVIELNDSDYEGGWNSCNIPVLIPHYSTDITAAWEVVERLTEYSESHFVIEKVGAWLVRFRGGAFTPGVTCPHAICLAALKAVGVSIDETTN